MNFLPTKLDGAPQLKLNQPNSKIPGEIALKCHFFISGGNETTLSGENELRLPRSANEETLCAQSLRIATVLEKV